ncbi:CoA transferase, partial [Streptomyces spiramenti]
MIHPVVEVLTPLSGRRCAVTGTGTAARVVTDHLRRLGATVRTAPGDPGGGAEDVGEEGAGDAPAPAVRVRTAGAGRAPGVIVPGVIVRWADALPAGTVHDETSAQAVCGLMHVHGRRHGRPRSLRPDVATTAAGVLATTALLAQLYAGGRSAGRTVSTTGVDRAALALVAHHLAVAGSDAGPPADAPGGPPFRSADGVWFEIEALAAEGWAAFWEQLGVDRAAVRGGWRPFAERFTTAVAPLPPELHGATLRRPWAELRELAARCGVSSCPVAAAVP